MTTSVLATIDTSELLTLPQVSKALAAPYQTCYSWVTSGRLPAEFFAGRWVVTVSDVERFKRELRAVKGPEV